MFKVTNVNIHIDIVFISKKSSQFKMVKVTVRYIYTYYISNMNSINTINLISHVVIVNNSINFN